MTAAEIESRGFEQKDAQKFTREFVALRMHESAVLRRRVLDQETTGYRIINGEAKKLTRLIEAGTEKNLPVIIISTSGGARMYEGMFSLMQMAKKTSILKKSLRRKQVRR